MNLRLTILILGIAITATHGETSTKLPWSFAPLEQQPLPQTQPSDWPTTRTDRFLLARIEAKGLKPAEPATDRELLRRVYFDLIGLPPSPEQVANFQRANFPQVVDELLSSPHYGERWGRHWLDLARYTDKTAGWLNSSAAPWLYRDWVVAAFNNDLPYNEFVKRQLANDLIPDSDPKDNAALGFLGLSPTYWKELQLPPEIIKTTVADEWEERMDAVGRTFLGLTIACARCHDHKTDPITQADYYAIAGVFASVRIADRPQMTETLWSPVAKARADVAAHEKKIAELKKDKKAPAEQTAATINELTDKIATLKKDTPHYGLSMVSGVTEAALFVNPAKGTHGTALDYKEGEARDLAIHKRGNPNQPGETVPRRFLSAFPVKNNAATTFSHGSGRLDLAEAITTEAAPLAARVIVNRVWQHHFGRGLAPTPSELGFSGEPPTHPGLLTDLATRFVDNGWSLKWLHREILLSAAWQQSIHNPESQSLDPANSLFSRMNRRQLDVEAWRDSMLQVSGLLETTVGGAPLELTSRENHRRTLYGMIHRRDLNQMLRIHDFPNPTAHAPSRPRTITPLQQLFTLNSPFIQWQAEALAGNLLKLDPDRDARVTHAYQTLFQRTPREHELRLAREFMSQDPDDPETWTQYAQALLAGNEFLFIE